MTAGRKAQPLSNTSKNWTKAEIQAKEAAEKKLDSFESLSATPPSSLTKEGKKEYKRVYKLLETLPLSNLDQQVFIQYCDLVATTEQLKYEINLLQSEVVESLENNNLNVALDKQLTTKRNQLSNYYKEIKSHASLIDKAVDDEDEFLKAFGVDDD